MRHRNITISDSQIARTVRTAAMPIALFAVLSVSTMNKINVKQMTPTGIYHISETERTKKERRSNAVKMHKNKETEKSKSRVN